jgi:hypothetical protein
VEAAIALQMLITEQEKGMVEFYSAVSHFWTDVFSTSKKLESCHVTFTVSSLTEYQTHAVK